MQSAVKSTDFPKNTKEACTARFFLFKHIRQALTVFRQRVADILPRKAAPLQKGNRFVDLLPVGHIAAQTLIQQRDELRLIG